MSLIFLVSGLKLATGDEILLAVASVFGGDRGMVRLRSELTLL